MQQSIAYSNGEFIQHEDLRVQPQDLGFMWGVTVAEQLRTFRGELFLLNEHMQRLASSLATIGVEVSTDELAVAATKVVEHNYALIDPSLDLGLTIYVTPGLSSTYSPGSDPEPNVGVHSYVLPFALWVDKYANGQECELTSVPQVPAACWPRGLKARSRMHYYLADAEARSRCASARAILLDEDGCVNEASTANVVAHFPAEGLVSPPVEAILPGMSLGYLESLAREQDIPFAYRPIPVEELALADQLLLTSTPFCLLPVSRLGEREYSSRAVFLQLIKQWSDRVHVNILEQSQS